MAGTSRNRRWFIYRDENKKEIASIQNAEDYAAIVVRLARSVKEHYIDLADNEDLTRAIQAALPEDMKWPAESCIDILIKGAERFNRSYHKSEINNEGRESSDAFMWLVKNLSAIKEYHYGSTVQADPDAIIICGDDVRNNVRRDTYKMLLKTAENTDDPEYYAKKIHVIRDKGKLKVYYPIGEVYGCAYDYVEGVKRRFEELKKEYKSISICGLVYYLETVMYATTGAYFWCDSSEPKVHSTLKWQKCRQCGKIYTEDVYYNSSQWEDREGTLGCLCSPACMIEYCLGTKCDDGDFRVLPNDSIMEKYPDLWDDMDWDECSRDIIWDEFLPRFDKCIKDLAEQKDRLIEYKNSKMINMSRWDEFVKKAKEYGIDI